MDGKTSFFVFLALFFVTVLSDEKCPDFCFCENNYVNCVGDGLWTIPRDLPTTAERMELRNFLTVTILVDYFKDLKNLRELKLQQMQTSSIEAGAFRNLENLHRLEINQNLLSNLTVDAFEGLEKLRYLDLSSNNLTNCPFNKHLEGLEQLNLRANQLSVLVKESFNGLYKLQYLNLDSNRITSIHNDTFQYLLKLAHLILSNNPIKSLPSLNFLSLRLQYVDLSLIGIDKVPQTLRKFVRDLRLSKNNLTIIRKGDFDNYSYLGLLVLDQNGITEIENNSFQQQKYLMRLWINSNRLSIIPSNLPSSLKALHMGENFLTSLPAHSFRGLKSLEQLFLPRNKIGYISKCAFCDLTSLRNLDLQSNAIEVLNEGMFENVNSLETLILLQNDIKKMSSKCFLPLRKLSVLNLAEIKTDIIVENGAFDPLQNLSNLDLYNSPNLTKTIINSTNILTNLRSIQELNLENNKLQNLREDFPLFFPNLSLIRLSDNIWHCDRNILWLSQWMKSKTNITFSAKESILCWTPISMNRKQVIKLESKDFPTEKPTSSIETITGSINSSKIITSSATISYTFTTYGKASPNDTVNGLNPTEDKTSKNTVDQSNDNLTKTFRTKISTNRPSNKEFLMRESSKKATTNSIIIACMVLACLAVIVLIILILYKLKKKNNISYSAQTNDSNVLTEEYPNNGIGNKLYYVVENPNIFEDSTSDIYSNLVCQDTTDPIYNNNPQNSKTPTDVL